MAVILNEEAIELLLEALSEGATQVQRSFVREQLSEAAEIGAPDEIDIFRMMKKAEGRKRIDLARVVRKEMFGPG